MATKKINTKDIVRDPRTQMREKELDPAVVTEYALAMENGDEFPPIIVFSVDGKSAPYVLADGWYRTAAAEKAYNAAPDVGVMIEANVRKGDIDDATLYAVGANTDHGVRRTNADKRKAVRTLLAHDEWTGWSDGVIAKRAKVSQPFVSSLRRDAEDVVPAKKGDSQNVLSTRPPKRKGADGVMRSTPARKPKAESSKSKDEDVHVQVTDRRRFAESSEAASAPAGPAPGMIEVKGKEKAIGDLLNGRPLWVQFVFAPKVGGAMVSVTRGPGTDPTRAFVKPEDLPRMPQSVLEAITEQLNGKAGK